MNDNTFLWTAMCGHIVLRERLEWIRDEQCVGSIVAASELYGMLGPLIVNKSEFDNKYIRQVGEGQVDDMDNDISGFFVILDALLVFLYDDLLEARRWCEDVRKVNIDNSPSLCYIKAENSMKLAVVNPKDLADILMTHPIMLKRRLQL